MGGNFRADRRIGISVDAVKITHDAPLASSSPDMAAAVTFACAANMNYHGVRKRSWGKWVSEIREPKKKTRIWLGSYPQAEMAARAYDVAARCLKGKAAVLNFPDLVDVLPHPASPLPRDIQAAAQAAATLSSSRVSIDQNTAHIFDEPFSMPCKDRFTDDEAKSCVARQGNTVQSTFDDLSMGSVNVDEPQITAYNYPLIISFDYISKSSTILSDTSNSYEHMYRTDEIFPVMPTSSPPQYSGGMLSGVNENTENTDASSYISCDAEGLCLWDYSQ